MISARGISASLAVHAAFAGWFVNAAPLSRDIVEDAEAAPAIEVLLEIEPEPVAEASLASQQQLAIVTERTPVEPAVEVTEAIDPPERVAEPTPPPLEPLLQPPQIETQAAVEQPMPEMELPPLAELPAPNLSDFEKSVAKTADAPVVPVPQKAEPQKLVPQKIARPEPPALPKVADVKPREVEAAKPRGPKPKKKVAKAAKPVAEKPVAALKNSTSSKKAFTATAGRKALASGGKAIDPSYKSRVLSKLRAAKRAPKASASGRVVLSFTVSRSGSLLSARITKSGGPALDQATLAMARAAAPFPPMPPGMNRASMSFTVPVQYN